MLRTLAAVVLAATLLSACRGTPAELSPTSSALAATPAPSTTPSPSPTATPAPSAVAHLRWTSLPSPIPANDAVVGIAAGGSPRLWIAVTQFGNVWRSADGTTWTHGASLSWSALAPGQDQHWVVALTYAAGRFVASGQGGSTSSGAISLAAYYPGGGVTWASTDGIHWRTAAVPSTADSGPMTIVALLGDAKRVVGVALPAAGPTAQLATSTDGLTWRLSPFARPMDQPSMLLRLPDGSYLAGGVSFGDPGACPSSPGMLWRSPDLTSWTAETGAAGCDAIAALAAGTAGALIEAVDPTNAIVLFGSADTRTWHQLASDLPPSAKLLGTAPDGTFLALVDGSGIYESRDGIAWARSLPVDANGAVYLDGHLIACHDQLVCVEGVLAP